MSAAQQMGIFQQPAKADAEAFPSPAFSLLPLVQGRFERVRSASAGVLELRIYSLP